MSTRVAELTPANAVLLGFGAVGTRVAELLPRVIPRLRVVGVSDSSGGTFNSAGIDLPALLRHKRGGTAKSTNDGVASFPGGEPCADSLALYERAVSSTSGLHLLIDLSPVNLDTGEPSLPLLRRALSQGVSAVLANKAPLVLDFSGLKAAASRGAALAAKPHEGGQDAGTTLTMPLRPPRLAFSATVCGGLPVVNVGVRDLRGAAFERVEGIFNSTTNFILAEMEAGRGRADALREAQRVGIAEADPSLDVEGLDTANKLVILSNEVLGQAVTLADVSVTGISAVTDEDVQGALSAGECIRLVARAVRRGPASSSSSSSSAVGGEGHSYSYTVAPERVKIDSHLGQCKGTSMCCRYVTDIFETIDLRTDEKGVYPTAAAVLRDCFDVLHTAAR